jgi:hypothetical protein
MVPEETDAAINTSFSLWTKVNSAIPLCHRLNFPLNASVRS